MSKYLWPLLVIDNIQCNYWFSFFFLTGRGPSPRTVIHWSAFFMAEEVQHKFSSKSIGRAWPILLFCWTLKIFRRSNDVYETIKQRGVQGNLRHSMGWGLECPQMETLHLEAWLVSAASGRSGWEEFERKAMKKMLLVSIILRFFCECFSAICHLQTQTCTLSCLHLLTTTIMHHPQTTWSLPSHIPSLQSTHASPYPQCLLYIDSFSVTWKLWNNTKCQKMREWTWRNYSQLICLLQQ